VGSVEIILAGQPDHYRDLQHGIDGMVAELSIAEGDHLSVGF
jgi:hypothetical protein